MTARPALLLILCMLVPPATRAAPPPSAQVEIDYLLAHVGASGCEFYRNGSWYDAARAQAHLRAKYDYLAARNLVRSAEDFIDKAATKSSLSGQPYQIRCAGYAAVASSQWLRDALARYRDQTGGPPTAEPAAPSHPHP
jgi:Family of unknown function (DUF5329)